MNAPLHLKRRFLSAALSADLRARYGARNIPIREGDTVRLVKGEFRGITGKVNSVNLKQGTVYVDGAERVRKDGTKSFFPVMPSSLIISEALFEDKRRAAHASRRNRSAKNESVKPKANAVKK